MQEMYLRETILVSSQQHQLKMGTTVKRVISASFKFCTQQLNFTLSVTKMEISENVLFTLGWKNSTLMMYDGIGDSLFQLLI